MSGRAPAREAGLQPAHRAELDRFTDALWLEHGLATNTLAGYRSDLARFAAWLETRAQRLPAVGGADLAAYLAEFSRAAKPASQRRLIAAWRRYYRLLLANREIAEDPTLVIDTPQAAERFPNAHEKRREFVAERKEEVAARIGRGETIAGIEVKARQEQRVREMAQDQILQKSRSR